MLSHSCHLQNYIAGSLVFYRLIYVDAFGQLYKQQSVVLYGYKIIARMDSVGERVFVVLLEEIV